MLGSLFLSLMLTIASVMAPAADGGGTPFGAATVTTADGGGTPFTAIATPSPADGGGTPFGH